MYNSPVMPKYRYDASAFVKESIRIEVPEVDNPKAKRELTFTELSHSQLHEMVHELFDINQLKTVGEGEGAHTQRKTFDELATEVTKPLIKWLSISTGEDQKYFEKLCHSLSTSGVSKLIEILHEVNHIEEILQTGGNLMMLPVVQRIMKVANEPSESQESTSLTISEA